jgi:hypothetical protein
MYIGTYCTNEIKIQIPHYDGWKKPHYKWEINVREQYGVQKTKKNKTKTQHVCWTPLYANKHI